MVSFAELSENSTELGIRGQFVVPFCLQFPGAFSHRPSEPSRGEFLVHAFCVLFSFAF